jgi:hypothetical protein
MMQERMSDWEEITRRAKKLSKKKKSVWNKPLDWQTTIIIAIGIIGLFAIVLALIIPPVSFQANCEVKNISYTNVCPNDCWNNNINCRFCPLPKDLSCNADIKAPVLKLIEMFQ